MGFGCVGQPSHFVYAAASRAYTNTKCARRGIGIIYGVNFGTFYKLPLHYYLYCSGDRKWNMITVVVVVVALAAGREIICIGRVQKLGVN